MTLISVYNSEGCVGRCDAKCYEATHPDCDCVCGGRNHGAGFKQASANVQAYADHMMDEWRASHPGSRFELPGTQAPLDLVFED